MDRRGMPASGEVIGQRHVTGPEDPLGSVAQTDLDLPFQGDDILAARGRVPVEEIPRLVAAEMDVLGVLNRRPLCRGYLLVGEVNLFKMGLAVVSGADADYLHRGLLCCLLVWKRVWGDGAS